MDERMDRQQFDGRDAERVQMVDNVGSAKAAKRYPRSVGPKCLAAAWSFRANALHK